MNKKYLTKWLICWLLLIFIGLVIGCAHAPSPATLSSDIAASAGQNKVLAILEPSWRTKLMRTAETRYLIPDNARSRVYRDALQRRLIRHASRYGYEILGTNFTDGRIKRYGLLRAVREIYARTKAEGLTQEGYQIITSQTASKFKKTLGADLLLATWGETAIDITGQIVESDWERTTMEAKKAGTFRYPKPYDGLRVILIDLKTGTVLWYDEFFWSHGKFIDLKRDRKKIRKMVTKLLKDIPTGSALVADCYPDGRHPDFVLFKPRIKRVAILMPKWTTWTVSPIAINRIPQNEKMALLYQEYLALPLLKRHYNVLDSGLVNTRVRKYNLETKIDKIYREIDMINSKILSKEYRAAPLPGRPEGYRISEASLVGSLRELKEILSRYRAAPLLGNLEDFNYKVSDLETLHELKRILNADAILLGKGENYLKSKEYWAAEIAREIAGVIVEPSPPGAPELPEIEPYVDVWLFMVDLDTGTLLVRGHKYVGNQKITPKSKTVFQDKVVNPLYRALPLGPVKDPKVTGLKTD